MLIKVAMLLQICTAVGSQVETIGDVITLSAYNYWVITLHTAKALDNKQLQHYLKKGHKHKSKKLYPFKV